MAVVQRLCLQYQKMKRTSSLGCKQYYMQNTHHTCVFLKVKSNLLYFTISVANNIVMFAERRFSVNSTLSHIGVSSNISFHIGN